MYAEAPLDWTEHVHARRRSNCRIVKLASLGQHAHMISRYIPVESSSSIKACMQARSGSRQRLTQVHIHASSRHILHSRVRCSMGTAGRLHQLWGVLRRVWLLNDH